MERLPWNEYFMVMAKVAAFRSGCNSRPTGAVIVKDKRIIATGYNGSLPGFPQCTDKGSDYCFRRTIIKDDTGEKKYQECSAVHGEQNAMNQAAKQGISIDGATIYCTLQPCIFCLKNIASVGIKRIFYELKYHSNDPIRDKYWADKIQEYGLIAIRMSLGREQKFDICNQLISNTSERRI